MSGDWRGETLARLRALIKGADPAVVEEVMTVECQDAALMCEPLLYYNAAFRAIR